MGPDLITRAVRRAQPATHRIAGAPSVLLEHPAGVLIRQTFTQRRVGDVVIRLTERARAALRPDEVLVVDWHSVAICCAAAGDVSISAVPRARLAGTGDRFRRAECDPPDSVLVHRRAYPYLLARDVLLDCRTMLGARSFSSDLPTDFGLRASLGRLPTPS